MNIGTGVHYTAIHNHKFYREKYSHKPEDFPHANHISERTISLPLSSALDPSDIEDVINAVIEIVNSFLS